MTTKTSTKKTTKTLKVAKPLPNLPNQPFVFEVFDLVSRQRSKAKKIEVLRKYDEQHIRRLFIWNFDQSIESAVPAGEVPYADPEDQVSYSGTLTTRLNEEIRSMHDKGNFSLGVSDQKDKKLSDKYKITREIVEEAYPNIIWGDRR